MCFIGTEWELSEQFCLVFLAGTPLHCFEVCPGDTERAEITLAKRANPPAEIAAQSDQPNVYVLYLITVLLSLISHNINAVP